MGRSKIKLIKSAVGNKDITNMFQNMMGIGDSDTIDTSIIYNKYEQIYVGIKKYLKLMDLLGISEAMKYHDSMKDYLNEYRAILKESANNLFTMVELSEIEKLNINGLPADKRESISETYKAIKDSKLLESIIITCKNLIQYKKFISDQDKLSDQFLLSMPGLKYNPISGAEEINFKLLYCNVLLNDQDKKFILTIIHKIFIISYELYDILSSPDIDIDKFVEVIMTAIKDVRKKIPRCNEAFNIIINSVGLLKNNFKGYYKDFVASSNPSVIMENFIVDVSNNTNPTPLLASQFTRIIAYYNRLASQNNNPQVKTIFNFLNQSMDEINKYSKEAGTDLSEDNTEDTSEDTTESTSESTTENTTSQ
jgi:hypothetical protein